MTNPENRQISPDDFARIVMARLHQTNATATVNYDREHFCLRGDADHVFNLGELYKAYGATDGESRTKLISDIARIWFRQDYTLPKEFADAAHDLMPYVHARGFYETHAGHWPYQVLGEHFGVALAYERLESRQLVTQADLDTWGMSLAEALETAKENLRRLPANIARPTTGEGAWWMMTGDERSSAYLLLTDVVGQLDVRGDTIVMVPNRDTLFIAGSDDNAALAQMVRIAMAAPTQLRPISGLALRLDGDAWEPWLPGESHPLHQDMKELQLRSIEVAYNAQQELLEENTEDIFVAPFLFARRPDGTTTSVTVWPAVGESMLPKAEVIAFKHHGTGPASTISVTWQGAESVVGNLMEPLDMYPPRYRVRAFPTEEQLAWMASEHSVKG